MFQNILNENLNNVTLLAVYITWPLFRNRETEGKSERGDRENERKREREKEIKR